MADPESFTQEESPGTLRIMFRTGMANVDRACHAVTDYLNTTVSGSKPHLFAINLLLREGLTNAVRHGNDNDPDKHVTLTVTLESSDLLCITIQDEGNGFSWQDAAVGLPDDDADHGRGLAIIDAYCTEYCFNHRGNCLTLKKQLVP